MVFTLAGNANNDLYIGADGQLAAVSDIDAVLDACEQAVKAMRGEMPFAIDEGMPNFDVLWVGAPNLQQFEAALRSTILAVDHVVQISSLDITVANGAFSYTAVIVTDFGVGELNA